MSSQLYHAKMSTQQTLALIDAGEGVSMQRFSLIAFDEHFNYSHHYDLQSSLY